MSMNAPSPHSAQRTAPSAAMLAIACFLAPLLLCAPFAFAWLIDEVRCLNLIDVSAPAEALEEPYAALYADDDATTCTLAFGRGETVPASLEGCPLAASWRGMETGDADFSIAGARPWEAHASQIGSVVSTGEAARAPIRVLDMERWFKDMSALTRADVSGLTPSTRAEGTRPASTDLSEMFANCASLERIDGIENWDASGQKTARSMFSLCSSLTMLDLSGWDMTSITDAESMFYHCSQMTTLDLGRAELPACENIAWMFAECHALHTIAGMENLCCPKAVHLSRTFWNCESIERIDLGRLGSPTISDAAYLLEGCASLRYLDISDMRLQLSGQAGWGFYPSASELETFITSNLIYTQSAPAPGAWRSEDGMTFSPGAWVGEDGIAFSQQDLANHLSAFATSETGHVKMTFHRTSIIFTREDAYAAIYDRGPDGFLLIMDVGASAPLTRDGAPLKTEIRDILASGENAAGEWKRWPISDIRICSELKPLSCRSWFEGMGALERIEGLDSLDMSACRDVTHLFYNSGVRELAFPGWRLDAAADGVSEMLAQTAELRSLDLSGWIGEARFSFAGMRSLARVALSPQVSFHSLSYTYPNEATRFHDGFWYQDGYGQPLDASTIATMSAEPHQGSLVFMHEKLDRAYAAVYADGAGMALAFGRGLDVPATFGGGMLEAAYRGLEEQDLGSLDWSSFTEDACPWSIYAAQLTEICSDPSLDAPLRPRDTARWFQGCTQLRRIDVLETGGIDPSLSRSASWMFFECSSLATIPASFIGSFSSDLTETMAMFAGCAKLEQLDALPPQAMANVTDAHRMFERCSSLGSLDLSGWDISSLRTCSAMFSDCTALETLSLPERFASPERPDALQLAFYRCFSLTSIDATTWDLSGSYTLFHAFDACRSLTSLIGAESWDTAKVTTMNSTFRQCSALVLDCSNWDVRAVTDSDSFAWDAPGIISPFEDARTLADERRADAEKAGTDAGQEMSDAPCEDESTKAADEGCGSASDAEAAGSSAEEPMDTIDAVPPIHDQVAEGTGGASSVADGA